MDGLTPPGRIMAWALCITFISLCLRFIVYMWSV